MSQKLWYLRYINLYTKLFIGFLLVILLSLACSKDRLGDGWSVPNNLIADGEGDGDIPAINDPKFTKADQVTYLTDSSRVICIKLKNQIRAYPIEIMNWHEVVNDQIDSIPFALTYSALSGSSVAFNSVFGREQLTFKVSGLLYNSNSIFRDIETNTNWSQFLKKGIKGTNDEKKLLTFSVFEMTWAKWKMLFPEGGVLNLNTGYNRPYSTYPYGDYQTDSTKLFFNLRITRDTSIDSLNCIYPLKEKIIGVNVNDVVLVFKRQLFAEKGFSLIETSIDNVPIIIIGSQEHQFFIAYSREANDGTIHDFSIIEDKNQVLLLDENGNQWSIFGESLTNEKIKLNKVDATVAYWFTWANFYPDSEFFE